MVTEFPPLFLEKCCQFCLPSVHFVVALLYISFGVGGLMWIWLYQFLSSLIYLCIYKEKLHNLIQRAFLRRNLVCNEKPALFTSEIHKHFTLWSCQKDCVALSFCTILYQQIVGTYGYKLCPSLTPPPYCRFVSVLLRNRLYAISFSRKTTTLFYNSIQCVNIWMTY